MLEGNVSPVRYDLLERDDLSLGHFGETVARQHRGLELEVHVVGRLIEEGMQNRGEERFSVAGNS